VDDDIHAPLRPDARQIMDDLAASEADEVAGRTDSAEGLLAEMDRMAAQLRAKITHRGA